MEGANAHCSAMATQLQAAPARLNCFALVPFGVQHTSSRIRRFPHILSNGILTYLYC